MDHYWGKEMSETRSITYNLYGIKEPINTLSCIVAIVYVLYNYEKNKILKNLIILNLVFAIIAHSTYNDIAIKLDGLSLALPILAICYYYKWYKELFVLCLFFLFCLKIEREGLVMIVGLIIIFYNKKNDIINKNNFKKGCILCIISFILRLLDEAYPDYWWFYLHSVWHILMTIGLVMIIDSIKW